MIVPSAFNSYWGVFLTLSCNLKCPFCIQKMAGPVSNYPLASGKDWVKSLNSVEERSKKRFLRRNKVKKLALIGGEPTLHPDFFEIINGLDNNWNITVTTNLASPVFENISLFVRNLKRKKRIRFHVSFHDAEIDINEFINKIKLLRKKGVNVNRIFTVCWPPDKLEVFQKYVHIFKSRGLSLKRQRFNGFYKGKFYPFGGEEDDYEFKDNITEYEKYERGCSCKAKQEIYCKMNKVLFAPDGKVYNCHYKIYSGSPDYYGNIFNGNSVVNIPKDYFVCSDYGYCNPCDWPYAQFMNI